ncbi:prostaglandin F2-alpha receptor [Pygocentrus nattereri]|uniref:prostaglandin F2-alpha receptor n=1 Tax=Pygocentrus nattereri TaxID=42514 RepID=UPI000814670B|nr:prostaglandin F2-alpha receptor [Pygocentrus nattereri]
MSYNRTSKAGPSSSMYNENCNKGDVSVTTVVNMTVGIVSNTLAFFIVLKAYRRFRLKSKASFLLFASGLVLTDLLGHVMNGSLALYVYASDKDWESFDPKQILCGFFGVCMTFFGLSPLLLGTIMAVERCMGVTRPLFHSMALTSNRINRLLALTWLLALLVALLPVLVQRPYQVQGSCSWCFFRMVGPRDWLDILLPMIFSVLGLLSLLVSFVCNSVTGFTLLWSRLHREHDYHRHHRSTIHFEMVCQLLAIMIVSCVCWGPLLVTIIIITLQRQDAHGHLLLTVRLATWNQILDPWVYILLRKAVLKRLLLLAQRCHSSRPKHAFGWRFSTLGSSVETSSSVNSRPDFICLDGPFLPDTLLRPIGHFP